MDWILDMVIFLPLIGFAIYGFNHFFDEKLKGYFIGDTNTLDELWMYSRTHFFKHVLKEKTANKAAREMRPVIVNICLLLAKEQLETEGEKSKVHSLFKNSARVICMNPKLSDKRG